MLCVKDFDSHSLACRGFFFLTVAGIWRLRSLSTRSVRYQIKCADQALAQGRLSDALRIAHDFVERVFSQPLCTSQVLASPEFDDLCLRVGAAAFARRQSETAQNPWPSRPDQPLVVYLLSKWQRSGGHSRLVLDFIKAQPGKCHLVLATGLAGPSDVDYFYEAVGQTEDVLFLTAPKTRLEKKLDWVQGVLLGCQPEHVHLLNHHQDSVAVAALVPQLGLAGSFWHHGDHHLSLGVHMPHLAHVDLHPMGYHCCRDELGVRNCYLPLTFQDQGLETWDSVFEDHGVLTTATVARSNKIEIPYYVSYLEIIPQILKRTGGRHVHIGKLSPWALRRMRQEMRKLGVPQERLVYLEWTPSVWRSMREHKIDVYLASFPYGAGLTLIEVMGAGVPVIMHQHIYSRVLSSLELAYPEAFSWSDPEVLMDHLLSLTPEGLKAEKQLARRHYECHHTAFALQVFLRNPEAVDVPVPALASGFRPRMDEWAAWVESQVTWRKILFRWAYRVARNLRMRLN